MKFSIPPAAPIVDCRSCGAPIVWVRTVAGYRMPVNAAPGELDGESHFATCPHADAWRKKKEQAHG
jgi:hypothetical protein